MPRLEPLERKDCAGVDGALGLAEQRLGFVPNSMLIMARKPAILNAFSDLAHAAAAPGRVPGALKALIAHVASRSAGCRYCMAHTAGTSLNRGVPADKLAAVWQYETSPLFSAAERAALRLAQLAAQVPNAVADEDFAALSAHFDDEAVVEIVALISVFGFLNRWNDTMATPLEAEPIAVGERHLADAGWTVGKHAG